jgi:hypothetical protein
MSGDVEQLDRDINRPLIHRHVRLDLGRGTRIFAQPNVNKHVHVTLGDSEATLILHPHAARRLIKAMTAVLDGKDFDRG